MAASKKKLPKVFIDANIVIQQGKPPGGPLMERLVDLAEAGLVQVVTTDLTIAEVAKKHISNDFEVIKDVGRPHFRKLASEHLGVSLPHINKATIKEAIQKKYPKKVADQFKSMGAKILSIDTVKPSTVFDAYTNETGFFSSDAKKDQFSDAFIFECLKAEASEETPVPIVSDDGDFERPTADAPHMKVVKTIPELFQELGLEVKAPNVLAFIAAHDLDLVQFADRELSDWGLQVADVEDGEIDESTVTNVELKDVATFGSLEKGGSILVAGTAEIVASVSFHHPNWDEAIWDSEDKRLMPFYDVTGEKEICFDAKFSMLVSTDMNGQPEEIVEFRFTDDESAFVDLYPRTAEY